jgi:hypothetical protein
MMTTAGAQGATGAAGADGEAGADKNTGTRFLMLTALPIQTTSRQMVWTETTV